MTRHKKRQVNVIEASATDVDPINQTVTFKGKSHHWCGGRMLTACADTSEVQGLVSATTMKYDYLVYAVGAETQTFNIPGVRENACFMKELDDAEKVRPRMSLSDGVLIAAADATSFPRLCGVCCVPWPE